MPTDTTTATPRVIVTLGDFAGIGPELAVRLLSKAENLQTAIVSLVATKDEVEQLTNAADVEVPLAESPQLGAVHLIDPASGYGDVPTGRASKEGGLRAFGDLQRAVDLVNDQMADGIMFLPLNKSSLHMAGMEEEDELRWFAKRLKHDGFTSELNLIEGMTTSRVTSHIALSEVATYISAGRVRQAINLLYRTIAATGDAAPRIGVAALNPHAGENGTFGREEIDHIAPGVELAREVDGIDAQGPFPSDTLFIRARRGDFDGVVTMYHDQGQIAMKLIGFDQGVTVQGGLPVPIATPAHGTAFDIVGKSTPDLNPSQRAFDVLVQMAHT
ncbi:MAG: 4-hydroxythreonine-4-phosphate dehydrogenase PdxA [Brachybacterium sp.]|nr:4-hydroxythreonine-4-phosphate dehydrogenase PdxA [Brachybacterium sp.]